MLPTKLLETFLWSLGYYGSLPEALSTYLKDQGFLGHLDEAMFDFLGSLGYTGTLPERVAQWEEDDLGVSSNPLEAYYTSGTILLHHNTEGAITSGGSATGFTNLGGGGALFDATVVGSPIPLSGNFLVAQPSTSYPQLSNPADLIGVRLMWVMSPTSATGTYMCFGSDIAPDPYIRLANGIAMQIYDGGGSISLSGITTSNAVRLFEVEIGASTATLWVNGVQIDSRSHTFTTLPLDNIMRRNSTSQAFSGLYGDIMGVVLGQGDTTDAVNTARTYLNDRFSLGLTF